MKVTFNINFHTVWGQKLCIVGSIPELGEWESSKAVDMLYVGDGNWQFSLDLKEVPSRIEYRYFLSVNDKQVFEEWDKNHILVPEPKVENYNLYDYWQVRPQNTAFFKSAFTKSLLAHPCDKYERVVRSNRKLRIKISAPRVERNQSIAITGNQACLGNWEPDKALLMSCETFPEWRIDLDANEISFPLEYKFLVWDNDKNFPLYWEKDENRVLNVTSVEENETMIVSGLYFRDNLPFWRCAGTVIPVFSLRSEGSFGVGDFGDLDKFVEWVAKTGQRVIQVLPINDTTMSHSWTDSYPYSAISIYALHPMYLDIRELGTLKSKSRNEYFRAKQQELNSKETVDYENVMKYKMEYIREYFKLHKSEILSDSSYLEFLEENNQWLKPYAAYSYLRDKYKTSDFRDWGEYSVYDKDKIEKLCDGSGKAYNEIALFCFIQFKLHNQLKKVYESAHKRGVVLKGDLPIGVNRTSIEAWTEPRYFNMTGQAGAPPDDFSVNGQNWMFPTYNWDELEKDDFVWWKNRFHKLEDYFDCFRIDHILGFFRIWEIPQDYVQGLCGHFNPAMPFSVEEIEQYGLTWNEELFTTPHISHKSLYDLLGDKAEIIEGKYLMPGCGNNLVLKPFCNTQRKIEKLFGSMNDDESRMTKEALFHIANEVLFLRDPKETDKFHPRISAYQSYVYKELSDADRYSFDQLYWHFFYHRHNDFWKEVALRRLTPLVSSTNMVVCGEDLGMIPDSVPDVMNKLQILSLEIERMPKTSHVEFSKLSSLPYMSVCTTSTHDMSPLRSWWKEDREKTQRYFNNVLHCQGEAPAECTSAIVEQILVNHLAAPSMFTLIPLQDWLGMDDSLKRKDAEAERINVPSEPLHYWCYRMHITLESLLAADNFNSRIRQMIQESKRR